MNVITGKHLNRRSLLKGVGAALALPMLDAMVPAGAAAGTGSAASAPPLRMAFTYVPNGVTIADWTPKAAGTGYEFTRILKPLESFRAHVNVLTGLAQHNAEALGDGGGVGRETPESGTYPAHQPFDGAGPPVRNLDRQWHGSQLSGTGRGGACEPASAEPDHATGPVGAGYSGTAVVSSSHPRRP